MTIIDFRKVGQKGLKNEDKVGQQFIWKGRSRTEKFEKRTKRIGKFEKEDKIGQKSDYFIKCYQRLTFYIFIFEPWCILINSLLSWSKDYFWVVEASQLTKKSLDGKLNGKILYKNRSKTWSKNKNLSLEKSGQKPGQIQKSCRATHTSPKMRTCPWKSGRNVTPYL